MQKWRVKISALIFLPIILFLGGCGGGGNDKPDNGGGTSNTVEVVYLGDANITGQHLQAYFTFKEKDAQSSSRGKTEIHDYVFNIAGASGCKMKNVNYSPTSIESYPSTLSIEGDFGPSTCKPKTYSLKYQETITIDGHSKTTTKTLSGKLYPDGGPYKISVAPNSFTITSISQIEQVDVLLMQGDKPVSDVNVTALLDLKYGMIDSYRKQTDSNGRVTFAYTAPKDIDSLDGIVAALKIQLEKDPSVSSQVSIKFSKTIPIDTKNMKLYSTPTEVNITEALEKQTFSFYLIDELTHSPIKDVLLQVEFFDPNYGTLDHYSGMTNENGMVAFKYNAPANILSVNDFNITFRIANGTPPLERNVTVRFDHTSYTLIADANIIVTKADSDQTIKVSLSKQENGGIEEPAVGKKVVAEYLMPMYGKLDTYEAEIDDSGFATFTYTSPARLDDLSDTNITFYYKENNNVIGKTTLLFRPSSTENQVRKLYVIPSKIIITEANENREIHIVTVNSKNIGVSSTVTIENPTLDDVEYGEFDPSEPVSTDAGGNAKVTYIAPDSISGLFERNITFTDASGLTKEFVIDFEQSAVGDIYEINVSIPDSLKVDDIDHISVTIHKKGDPNKVIEDDDVYNVNVTSVFDNILTLDGGEKSFEYKQAGTKTINVETSTLAGTAVLEINASIFNGDRNVTLETSIPVTVLSGPVSTMSMAYIGSGDCQSEPGLPADKYLVHIVDKYSNPAQSVTISPTLINGTKVTQTKSGQINNPGNPDFNDSTADYSSIDDSKDRLIILPTSDRTDQSYLGNWTIDEVLSNHELNFREEYYGNLEENLTYVIGNEERVVGGNLAVAHIVSPSGEYETDSGGGLKLEVCFDPALVTHTVSLAASTVNDGNRIGVGVKDFFRWSKFNSTTVTFDNDGALHAAGIRLGAEGLGVDLANIRVETSSFIVKTKPHCKIDPTMPTIVVTDDAGVAAIRVVTDGNISSTGGVNECSVTWNKTVGSIVSDY